MLVSSVVIENQMNLPIYGNRFIDLIQETQKLLMPMARLALRDNRSFENIERCKKRGGSMPPVVMRLPFRKAFAQRQYRLGTIESLNLALLIHAQHNRFIRRIHIQPDDV